MNQKQLARLNSLIADFGKVRNFQNLVHTEALQPNGQVHVLIAPDSGEEFPVISIGKQGGLGMPDIKSYPENGKASSFAYPGNDVLDAVLFGDKHLARQKAGRTKKAVVVEKAPVIDAVPEVLKQVFGGATVAAEGQEQEVAG